MSQGPAEAGRACGPSRGAEMRGYSLRAADSGFRGVISSAAPPAIGPGVGVEHATSGAVLVPCRATHRGVKAGAALTCRPTCAGGCDKCR